MKKKIKLLQRFASISLISISSILLFTDCTQNKTESFTLSEPTYEERISNLLPFVTAHGLNKKNYTDIYLMQADKCNACNTENFKRIKDYHTVKTGKVLFLVSDTENSLVNDLLNKYFNNVPHSIYYDSLKELGKQGLSFYRNLHVEMQDGNIRSWTFLQ